MPAFAGMTSVGEHISRTWYYWARRQSVILMLYLFPKNVQDNLTEEQKRVLLEVVRREYP
jgi:hypothetical protein